MKLQHFTSHPEIQFDIDLIARAVHAINKTVTVDIPQQFQDHPLETDNYLKHMRGDWINENLSRMVVTEGVAMVRFRRTNWKGRLLVDCRSRTSYSVTTIDNLRRIPKKHRKRPHFLQTILAIENAGYEGFNAQMTFLPDIFTSEEYKEDYAEIFAGMLNPDSGYHHCVIAYSIEDGEINDIRLEFLDSKFNVIDEMSLIEYIRPDFAKLTETNWVADDSITVSTEASKTLPKLKATIIAKLREEEKQG